MFEGLRCLIGQMKRLFDVIISSLIIVLISPVIVLAAVAIVVEDGFPVFFLQNRFGRGGEIFRMLKLRSMRKAREGVGAYFTSANDPRITKVGRFIRKYSIDELPQLFNVLKGDMSLVGPRPDVPQQRGQYSDEEWKERCSVRPGITGMAQALLRSQGTEAERLRMDLDYVRRQSIVLDLKIIFWTVGRISGRGGN